MSYQLIPCFCVSTRSVIDMLSIAAVSVLTFIGKCDINEKASFAIMRPYYRRRKKCFSFANTSMRLSVVFLINREGLAFAGNA